MFSEIRHFEPSLVGGIAKFAAFAVLAAGIVLFPAPVAAQQPGQKTFRPRRRRARH